MSNDNIIDHVVFHCEHCYDIRRLFFFLFLPYCSLFLPLSTQKIPFIFFTTFFPRNFFTKWEQNRHRIITFSENLSPLFHHLVTPFSPCFFFRGLLPPFCLIVHAPLNPRGLFKFHSRGKNRSVFFFPPLPPSAFFTISTQSAFSSSRTKCLPKVFSLLILSQHMFISLSKQHFHFSFLPLTSFFLPPSFLHPHNATFDTSVTIASIKPHNRLVNTLSKKSPMQQFA